MNNYTRQELGKLYELHNVTGQGVEVGTEYGRNALNIIKYYTGKLYCIDTWENENSYNTALKNLGKERCIRKSSFEAVKDFKNESLDFVYIDAAHDYENVKTDLFIWYQKVRPGGIISGHDYIEFQDYGVIKAVDEFLYYHFIFKGRTPQLYLIDQWDGDNNFRSWYFYKI